MARVIVKGNETFSCINRICYKDLVALSFQNISSCIKGELLSHRSNSLELIWCKGKITRWFEMAACKNCGKEWTWKQTVVTLFRFRLICPHCGKRQYLTAASKSKTGLFGFIPIISMPIFNLFHVSWWLIGIIMTPVLIVIWISYPYMIEFSNEDEPLW